MALLIAELFAFCKNLPDGSIVVTSSDVLLDLCCVQGSAAGDVAPVFAADSVTLVGIPEVLATAKNHVINIIATITVKFIIIYHDDGMFLFNI